jgi:acyl carrier protein
MRESLDEMVRAVVACHLAVARETISPATRLQRDLELDPLDLVLIALRIEDIVGLEFPIARLEGVRTVGDMVGIVKAMRAASFDEPVFTLDELRLKLASGA